MRRTTYEHVLRDGRPVVVRSPRGSVDTPGQFRENVVATVAAAALRRMLGR